MNDDQWDGICGSCGSADTGMESDTVGYPIAFCRTCGASDADET